MNYIGLLAGLCTTFSFLPQVFEIYKKKCIQGLSPFLLFIHSSGVSMWIFYGYYKKDMIIMIFNSISLIFLSFIILKYIQIKYLSRIESSIDDHLGIEKNVIDYVKNTDVMESAPDRLEISEKDAMESDCDHLVDIEVDDN